MNIISRNKSSNLEGNLNGHCNQAGIISQDLAAFHSQHLSLLPLGAQRAPAQPRFAVIFLCIGSGCIPYLLLTTLPKMLSILNDDDNPAFAVRRSLDTQPLRSQSSATSSSSSTPSNQPGP
ncbi:hypothetical protein VTN31DRAFT_4902 [Thermomyces dupontii]|uniref:uncharacterized protein n=1 Tax=Talaromyces thermophilus TaxID=28565 RepID=UPI00374480B6